MFKGHLAWIIIICLVASSLISCNNQSLGPAGGYPPSWPIKQLVIPPGAKFIQLPAHSYTGEDTAWFTDGEIEAAGLEQERTQWKVAFSSTATIDEIESHFDSILKPMGYEVLRRMTSDIDFEKLYLTTDRRSQVTLRYFELNSFGGGQDFQGWNLSIAEWRHGRLDDIPTTPIP